MNRRQWFASLGAAPVAAATADPEPECTLRAADYAMILMALRKFSGNQTKAARFLGISRRSLLYRMECHGIEDWQSESRALEAASAYAELTDLRANAEIARIRADWQIANLRAMLKECEKTLREQDRETALLDKLRAVI
jgi:hypothetical protein